MAIEAISHIDPSLIAGAADPAAGASGARFSEALQVELNSVNSKLVTAEGELRDLAAGKQTNLHHVMLSLEEAKLSFQTLVQVRNKVLEAYQELLRTQV